MKTSKALSIILAVFLLFSLTACGTEKETSDTNPEDDAVQLEETGLWSNAIYTENTELGTGEKTLILKVEAGEKSIVITVHSDKETVGEALQDNGIIEGEEGPYGLYISHVNGIKAVYEEDNAYWGFSKNGELLPTGVDMTNFNDGEQYELVYTKG